MCCLRSIVTEGKDTERETDALMKARKEEGKIEIRDEQRGMGKGCRRVASESMKTRGEGRMGRKKKGGSKEKRKKESYKLVIREKGMRYVGRGLQMCCLDGRKKE